MNAVSAPTSVWKNLAIALVMVLLVMQGCVRKEANVIVAPSSLNVFSSSSDTLLIETIKQRGSGLLLLGVSSTQFLDTSENFADPIVYPKGMSKVQRLEQATDFSAQKNYYIDIIKGEKNGGHVFVVDENNNNDLSDDSVRIYQPINWHTEEHLIPCKYTIHKHQEEQEDSTWFRIGVLFGDLYMGKNEHLVADFKIDEDEYGVGIAAPRSSALTYDSEDILTSPELALFSENSVRKDTLHERDILRLGEVLKLNRTYYRYDRTSYFGDTLVLVKEDNFHQLVGTQVGMIAPDFTCISSSGDTIESTSLLDRPLVIANSCGCGGDKESTKAFFEWRKRLEIGFTYFA